MDGLRANAFEGTDVCAARPTPPRRGLFFFRLEILPCSSRWSCVLGCGETVLLSSYCGRIAVRSETSVVPGSSLGETGTHITLFATVDAELRLCGTEHRHTRDTSNAREADDRKHSNHFDVLGENDTAIWANRVVTPSQRD